MWSVWCPINTPIYSSISPSPLVVPCTTVSCFLKYCLFTQGEEKFTFIEKCNNPRSVTLLIKGPNKHTLTQIKDAIRDGLRAIKNAIDDGCVVPGAGAVEVSMAEALVKYNPSVKDTAQLGVQAFADALLIFPRFLLRTLVLTFRKH